MKALFVFLFLLIVPFAYGQIQVLDTTAAGVEKLMQVGTFEDTDVTPLPVKIIESSTGTTTSWDWVKFNFGAKDTIASAPDTLFKVMFGTSGSFSTYFTKWWSGDIITDDTLEISTSATFATGTVQKILPSIFTPLPKLSIVYHSNLYIRRFIISGGTGTPNWIIRIWGF